MSDFMVAVFFGLGVGGWSYAQLTKHNGNATPANNFIAAIVAALVAAIFIFTFFKFVLGY